MKWRTTTKWISATHAKKHGIIYRIERVDDNYFVNRITAKKNADVGLGRSLKEAKMMAQQDLEDWLAGDTP